MGGQQCGAPFQLSPQAWPSRHSCPFVTEPTGTSNPVAQFWGLIQPNLERGVKGGCVCVNPFWAPSSPNTLGLQGGAHGCHIGMLGTLPV